MSDYSESGRKYIVVPRLGEISWLVHGFGTRRFTAAEFRTAPEWKKFAVVELEQVHSATVHIIDSLPSRPLRGDALATRNPWLLLLVKTADCLPVLLVDEPHQAVAAVHSGWRGTRRRIIERVLSVLRDRFGTLPASLLAALGPSIGASCYEVGEDVRQRFIASGHDRDVFRPIAGRLGKYAFDLREANRRQLLARGLRPGNIFDAGPCTHCETSFHSYRRDQHKAGRLLNFIGISRGLLPRS